jgi:hypothetical protein
MLTTGRRPRSADAECLAETPRYILNYGRLAMPMRLEDISVPLLSPDRLLCDMRTLECAGSSQDETSRAGPTAAHYTLLCTVLPRLTCPVCALVDGRGEQ